MTSVKLPASLHRHAASAAHTLRAAGRKDIGCAEQSSSRWKTQPRAVIENEMIVSFTKVNGLMEKKTGAAQLKWIASFMNSKLLCRCMLELDDPAFLCRRAAGFAPSLLLGVFDSPRATGTRFVESPAPTVIPREPIRSFLSDNADLLRCFEEPVACHGGLLVLRRYRCSTERGAVDLCACNPMTGHRCFLPSPEVYASAAAILIGENAAGNGSPFQLLAVDQVYENWGHTMVYHVRSQLFSSPGPFPATSPGGTWGPVSRIAPGGPANSFMPGEFSVERSLSWERRAVVVREGILAPPRWMRLDCFGERSGTVVICMGCQPGRLLLNLETKEVMHMSPEPKEESLEGRSLSRAPQGGEEAARGVPVLSRGFLCADELTRVAPSLSCRLAELRDVAAALSTMMTP
uniref:DUF7595 domain-containing protein n=1 Tax=Setaria viridis TaxID=4556 RepID=A0A4U6V7C8_SETVI|nr:hypothetical protein SEVIR_3G093700v2 [Setaria viridis]